MGKKIIVILPEVGVVVEFYSRNRPVRWGKIHKNFKNTDFDPKIKSIGFP